jgi:hypothetical protein
LIIVAFSYFTGYTGKPKGADGYEAIRPTGQDEQASKERTRRAEAHGLEHQTDNQDRQKQEGL